MKLIGLLLVWVPRLPALFTVCFVASMLGYLALVSLLVKAGGMETVADALWRAVGLPAAVPAQGIGVAIRVFWEGIVVVVVLFAGVVASYNLAALGHRLSRPRLRTSVAPPRPDQVAPPGTRLRHIERIGIILAGGGAKGAYQAGALRAIWEFLEAHGALDRVRMIAGTSIGSWNAMFWLSGLVKPAADGGPSAHEAWWRSITLSRILEFDQYLPLRGNHFVRPTPWRETFLDVFSSDAARPALSRCFTPDATGDPAGPHFYFTRSNVERGHLEFATNWPGLARLQRPQLSAPGGAVPVVPMDRYEVIHGPFDAALERTARAVFASMDLPPLFPYMPIRLDHTEYFEDGGVVDNLPMMFGTQVEACDLLFVLPLNASFAEPVNRTSIARRLFRVMDVRQGVIERNALKMTYLYNELAALRRRAMEQAAPAPAGTLESTALRRTHRPVSVFAICPAPPLAIGTTEFWKARQAGEAFELMYAATRYELEEHFERDTDPNWVRMTLVGPQGERSWTDDF